MKNALRIPILILLLIFLGCSKDNNEAPIVPKSDAKVLTSFILDSADNPALNTVISASINQANKTITAEVPFNTNITGLTPQISISDKASVDPKGPKDFSIPVIYTVTAEDGTTAAYNTSVTIQEKVNNAPLDFELISPTVNGPNAGISLTPTLSWNASTDPDGNTVIYDIYLNPGDTALELYAENVTDTRYSINQRLSVSENYVWRVVAKDPDGAMTSSETSNFSTRDIEFNTVPVTTNAEFPERYLHSAVVFQDKMWVIGGSDSNYEELNDIWFSTNNGKSWETISNNVPFSKRLGHTLTVYDNKMWVIAGKSANNDYKNDIWFSEDGENWVFLTDSAEFTARHGHTSVVFDNKLWVIGGFDVNGDRQNDVWSSTNGIFWNQETNAAPFNGRGNHTSVAFDNKIWVIGGGSRNDVWSSPDGITWTEENPFAPFTPRTGHTTVVFDNKMWVIGGIDNQDKKQDDVWYSKDGITWTEVPDNAPFLGRMFHTSVVFNNKIWVIAGNANLDGRIGNGEQINDVWNLD